jgi:hypothetical protein
MKNLETQQFKQEEPESERQKYHALYEGSKDKILSGFSESEQTEILKKQKILSSLAYFIGKDFEIPVELNEPGAGWHWDFKENKIRIDPKDLLEKPMDYLRFVISHEGGHRRISRTEFIPLEEWKEPGFSFMMNAIEDPRDNNFVAENYPKFKEQMALAYEHDIDIEDKSKEKAQKKLGYQPRFMQAGFEYIKQWYKERKGEELEISGDLPKEVKEAVQKTLKSAQDSWWRYPSRQEADDRKKGEENIKKYAKVSYEINRDEIWPEFKKLVDEDMKDQKMQEFMKDMEQKKAEGESGGELPQEMKDKLTPQEQKELEEAIEKALEETKRQEKGGEEKESADGGTPIDLDSLSDELKQKIKEYIDSLPEDKKRDIEESAQKALGEFGEEIADDVGGKLSDNPEKMAERKERGEKEIAEEENSQEKTPDKTEWSDKEQRAEENRKELRKKIEEILGDENDSLYRETLEEVSPLIDDLTGDLRDIFLKRKMKKTEAGFHHGRKWNVRKRIREKIAGIPLIKTEAREQPESASEEKDYAITLMIDLSGSMRGRKAQEAFKSAVVLSETLNNLDIKFEVVGFQDILLEFKTFEEDLNDEMREKLNGLVREISDNNPGGHNNAQDNNDGECLLEASKHLADQQSENKFLIVLSDGSPAMDSGAKSSAQLHNELKEAVKEISENTDQKLVGVGLLSDAVSRYYENNLPNVTVEEMAETLGELLREVIENY